MATTGGSSLLMDDMNLDRTLSDLESQLKNSEQEIARLREDNQRLQDLLDAPRLREQKARLEKQNQQLEERLDQVLKELKKSKAQSQSWATASAAAIPQGKFLPPIKFEAAPLGITIWRDEESGRNAKIIDFRRDEPQRKGLVKGDYIYKVNDVVVWDMEHSEILKEIQVALQTPPTELTFFRPTNDFAHDVVSEQHFEATLASIASYRAAEEWGSNTDDNKPPNQALLRYRGKLLLEMVYLLTEELPSSGPYGTMVNAHVSSWGASYSTVLALSQYEPTGNLDDIRTMLNTLTTVETQRQIFGLLTIYDTIRLLSVDVSNAHLDESNERNRVLFAKLADSLGCTAEQLSNMYELVNRERELARARSDLLGVRDLSEILSPREPNLQNGVDGERD